jgi:hypothetical protein
MGDMADYYSTDFGPEDDFQIAARRSLPDWRRDVRQDEWVSGDGARVKIADMTDSHLFFSLAKGYRGEYGPRSVAQSRMPSLEAEAKRRLQAKTKGAR